MKTLVVMDTTISTPQLLSPNTHFHWPNNKVVNEDSQPQLPTIIEKEKTSTNKEEEEEEKDHKTNINNNNINNVVQGHAPTTRKKLQALATSKVRSVLTVFSKNRSNTHIPFGLGFRVVGTLFGYRRGHVHIAFQKDPTSQPAFLIELATPITGLVREMASGLVRIALECDRQKKEEATEKNKKKGTSVIGLLQEPIWRTYCNGKKCGFASRRECGAKEWDILKAVEPISMGAGVLPAVDNDKDKYSDDGGGGGGGEVMYMRARFERIVGSRDSEAFYMMNPDSNGAPELSIYLLRV
ncbi:hypothetical protein TanjilG_18510 [Lupinus angustifolius]|uniref:Protein MIZU-KUSSEI 1 n=1 Tax=Lupinus angustifolius TaxID=3871 RepID=A0A4P1RWP9_LUPAN|nr:PREDICTED: protein MIZU-KUSSEI 1-like [Lupinus angustifolius]OIW19700.1 hypothetical protein TanjilG_18510 [Lupinus angustifolius]